jgi:CBS domain-containing protein
MVATTSATIAVLPGHLVEPAFYSRSGARFFADYIARLRRRSDSAPAFSTVEDLIATVPVVVGPDTPVVDIARRLADRDVHCAVADSGDGTYGIVTDAALGRRVVGDGVSPDAPTRAVTNPVVPVQLSDSSVEALIAMLDTRAEYLSVVDRSGTLRGALGARDFAKAPTTAGVGILEQLHRARDRAQLVELAKRAPAVLADIFERRLAAERVIRVYSSIVDAIIRQSLRLVFADHPDLPMNAFTWLCLGSHGSAKRHPCPGQLAERRPATQTATLTRASVTSTSCCPRRRSAGTTRRRPPMRDAAVRCVWPSGSPSRRRPLPGNYGKERACAVVVPTMSCGVSTETSGSARRASSRSITADTARSACSSGAWLTVVRSTWLSRANWLLS